MSTPLRFAYLAILRLHPVGFRAEFGDEMLWIFDEELRRGKGVPVLLDGLRSAFVQNLRPQEPQVQAAGSLYVELDSSLPSERIAQVILTCMFFCLCFTLFMSMVVPVMARPINRVIFRPIGFFYQGPMPHAEHRREKLPWQETAKRYRR